MKKKKMFPWKMPYIWNVKYGRSILARLLGLEIWKWFSIRIRFGTVLRRNRALVFVDGLRLRCRRRRCRDFDLGRLRRHDPYLDGGLRVLWRICFGVRAAFDRYDELANGTRASFAGDRSSGTWDHGRDGSYVMRRRTWMPLARRCGRGHPWATGGPIGLALAAALQAAAAMALAPAGPARRSRSPVVGRIRGRRAVVAVHGRHLALHQLGAHIRRHQIEPAPFVRGPNPLVLAQLAQIRVFDLRERAQRIVRVPRPGQRKLLLAAAVASITAVTTTAAAADISSFAVLTGHVCTPLQQSHNTPVSYYDNHFAARAY